MLVLLAAASVAAIPPDVERMPNLYRAPAGCADAQLRVVDRFGRPVPTRLNELPRPAAMLLVERRIDGCPVITVMRGAPSAYKLRPLDEAAPKD